MDESTEWLSKLYERFENDIQMLFQKEPLWKDCSNCSDGYCCQRETVPVMSPEWDNIIKYVKSNFTNIDKRRFETNVDKERLACPFLFHNRCAVYPIRPWSCRIYPYTISFHNSPTTTQSGDFFTPYCPTLAPIFGTKVRQIVRCEPAILGRLENSNLIQIQIDTTQPFMVIDITQYQNQYENNMPKNEFGTLLGDDMHKWVGLIKYLRDARKINQSKFLKLLGLD